MDYEKAYKDALAKARKYRDEEGFTEMEEIFPELKERDDEMIRQLLVRFVKYEMPDNYSDDISKDSCLSYLEKQKEKKPAEYLDKDKVYAIMNKLTNLSFSNLIPINSKEYKKLDEITSDVRSLLDYPIQQQPAEWSEKDEANIDYLIDYFNNIHKDITTGNDFPRSLACQFVNLLYRLKSLRPKPKEEWSEEDEKVYEKALDAIYYQDCNDKDDVLFALKDLCDLISKKRKVIPAYAQWKPSKEQINALYNLLNPCDEIDKVALESLYNDLKKL